MQTISARNLTWKSRKHRIAPDDGKRLRNRSCTVSGSEKITILWRFHFGSVHNFKHCYIHYVGEHLKNEFPDRLSCNRFIQLEHRVMIPLLPFLKLICSGECTDITFMDSTGIAVCNSKRIRRDKVFRDLAETGKSSMGRFFGFKLYPVCNDRGELLNFCLTGGNVDDRNTDVFRVPGRDLSGKPYVDKGYMSSSLSGLLFCDGIHLVTGTGRSMKNRLISLGDKILLRKRSVIETIDDELENICRAAHSRHRGTASFLINLLSRLAVYCFFDKKPAIRFDRNLPDGQLSLFY